MCWERAIQTKNITLFMDTFPPLFSDLNYLNSTRLNLTNNWHCICYCLLSLWYRWKVRLKLLVWVLRRVTVLLIRSSQKCIFLTRKVENEVEKAIYFWWRFLINKTIILRIPSRVMVSGVRNPGPWDRNHWLGVWRRPSDLRRSDWRPWSASPGPYWLLSSGLPDQHWSRSPTITCTKPDRGNSHSIRLEKFAINYLHFQTTTTCHC